MLPPAYLELKWEAPYIHATRTKGSVVLLNAAGRAIVDTYLWTPGGGKPRKLNLFFR